LGLGLCKLVLYKVGVQLDPLDSRVKELGRGRERGGRRQATRPAPWRGPRGCCEGARQAGSNRHRVNWH